MDFFEVVEQRRSIRTYSDTAVEPEKLQRILEAINRAPSAGNMQAYEVYVVRSAELRMGLVKAAADQEFMGQAPVTLVFCTNAARSQPRYGQRGVELYTLQDATIACTYAMLAAAALDLGTVWVGKFDEAAVTALLGLPADERPVALLPIGYAAEAPHSPRRRALADLIHEVQ